MDAPADVATWQRFRHTISDAAEMSALQSEASFSGGGGGSGGVGVSGERDDDASSIHSLAPGLRDADQPFESEPAALLRTVEDLGRMLRGGRLTSCKSAKDRTGMAVTYEEARFIAQFEAAVVASFSTTTTALSAMAAHAQQCRAGEGGAGGAGFTSVGALHALHGVDMTTYAFWSGKRVAAPWGAPLLRTIVPMPPRLYYKRWRRAFQRGVRIMHRVDAVGAPLQASVAGLASGVFASSTDIVRTLQRFVARDLTLSCALALGMTVEEAHAVVAAGDTPCSVPVRLVDRAVVATTASTTSAVQDILGLANFLREFGCRLDNAEKNTGAARFAFNVFQRAFFPYEYKCPLTVLGNAES
ncbi:hypothetical protein EON62_03250 [archaeon]|nr:MAG: hypothetical protein EON62_03250 [archaeon]